MQFVVPTRKNHTTEACYFNARSFPKEDGKGKRTSTPGSTNVSAVEKTASDNGELTSTIAALQQQLAALRLTGASSGSASSTRRPQRPHDPRRHFTRRTADAVCSRRGGGCSHASQGNAENTNRLMAGMLRTWHSTLNADLPHPQEPIDINHPILPWLCRWCAFVWARYHVKADKPTPFRIVTGREYKTPIVQFGEVVLAKDSNVQAISKARPRWFEGVFVGHLELDDSAVVLTDAEAITVRSFRRLPANDSAFLMRHVVCLGHLQANVPRSELKPVT